MPNQRNLQIGRYYTVNKGHKMYAGREDMSYRGDVFKLLVIDQPLIVVDRVYSKCFMPLARLSIDLREYSLMELSHEYVAALCPDEVNGEPTSETPPEDELF